MKNYGKEETKRFMLCVMLSQAQLQPLCDKASLSDLYLFGYTADDLIKYSLNIAKALQSVKQDDTPCLVSDCFLSECALSDSPYVTEQEAMRVLFALYNVSLFDTLLYVYSVIDNCE